ncbi:MAG TPA: HEAT repeat domain-containing protein [Candidatus Sulfotelmatobacter sp.]|jgi:HEAT repeat protein|nr:HEAT repeat domain-containing protein [Candidatus Sulfotelmatobacter sp.]
MRAKQKFIFITLAVVAGILVMAMFPCDPRYQGRTLTIWLRQYNDTPLDETQRLQEAQSAIRAIGAKAALPRLLKLVESTDDPVSLWLIDKTGKFRIRFLGWKTSDNFSLEDYDRIQWHTAEDFQQLGIAGFETLGTNAGAANEELEKLLQKKDHTFTAERCLEYIGKPAEPVFCRALTNQDPAIRQWAMDKLAPVTDDVIVYLNRIKDRLKDSSAAVRIQAVDDIGLQTEAPELAVPLICSALNDPSSDVCSHAAGVLAGFGTNALVAFPILTNLASGQGNVASTALSTLVIIAPGATWPILTNDLAQRKPEIQGALKALTDVLPGKALPILLARLQSPSEATRREAFGLLRHCPMTGQMDTVMQTLTTDPDPDLALVAKRYLTDQYETNHPDMLLFPDEPGWKGKRLGEWLDTRLEGGGDFTPAAKEAIDHLGTNAIPALLKRIAFTRPPYCFGAIQINLDAANGFIALGEKAGPALPELQVLMNSTHEEVALAAMIASCGTGSNAMPFLFRGLTNNFPHVRNCAADTLASGFGKGFPELRRQTMPILISLLGDPDEDVRGSATNALREIDPMAAARAGIK